jgi:hypothetical protein
MNVPTLPCDRAAPVTVKARATPGALFTIMKRLRETPYLVDNKSMVLLGFYRYRQEKAPNRIRYEFNDTNQVDVFDGPIHWVVTGTSLTRKPAP